ncbi:MAG: DUF6444 domain-containing protein [Treponema sp.]|jgi:hypothetical protein|nr:DUF6444 domain-containing protein [Treponema sp.]
MEMEGENLSELVKKQAETIKRLEARIGELEAVIARLQKNSRNSSKPPFINISNTAKNLRNLYIRKMLDNSRDMSNIDELIRGYNSLQVNESELISVVIDNLNK